MPVPGARWTWTGLRSPGAPSVTNPPPWFVFTSGVPRARDDKEDRDLLADLAAGNRDALARLYDRHAGSLFRHAFALSRRRPDAEDLVHSVFLKLAAAGTGLLEVRAPANYMHRMLQTAWLDARRRRAAADRALEAISAQRVTGEVVATTSGREAAAAARVTGGMSETTSRAEAPSVSVGAATAVVDSIDLDRALDALPAPQRQVIVLHLVEGFSFREIGRLTGVSLFTAAARYRLALYRLRSLLGGSRTR